MEHHKYKYSASHKNILWVEECTEIPIDCDGLMRVPMSYLLKHNPKQFELVYGGNSGVLIDKDKNNFSKTMFETPDRRQAFISFIIQRVKGAKI
jgi:hypothetical protein